MTPTAKPTTKASTRAATPAVPTLIQTLTLTLGTLQWEGQLSGATLTPNYTENAVTTFGGEFSTDNEKAVLSLAGFQDLGAVDSLCDMLWTTEVNAILDFTLEVGGASFAGKVTARKPSAGGTAGAPLTFTIDLPVQGPVDYTAATTP